jgi:tetratricopeptide (TPR) repeat protein
MSRRVLFAVLVLILLIPACGGGGGSDLVYKVSGSASTAQVEYKNAEGEMETETVSLPWETTIGVGNDFLFKLDVENAGQDGTVICEVWVDERDVGNREGNLAVGCTGSFEKDGNSFNSSFSSYSDPASQQATPEPAQEVEPVEPVKTPAPITAFERYEHNMNCTAYDPDLNLRAFTVLYPSGAVIEDCSKNPDNYVAFSLEPDPDNQDAAFIFVLGQFNFEPPGQIAYLAQGAYLVDLLSSQIESEYGAKTLESEPLVYHGVTLFHTDFSVEIKGAPRLIRIAAVPNLQGSNGVLFFAMQKVSDDYERELPEFDRVCREIIGSLEFPALGTSIGSITFAAGVSDDDEPLEPGDTFTAGIPEVFGVFEYADMSSGALFEFAWYIDGELTYSDSTAWYDDASGQTWVSIDHPDGLSAGEYQLQLSVNGELLQTGSFVVQEPSLDANAWFQQGIELDQRGAYAEALAALDKAIELDPNLAGAYNSRALVHAHLGEYAQAMEDVNQALELDPDLAEAHNTRGEIHRVQNQFELAISDYDQAIVLNPEDAVAHSNRGRAYRSLGDLEQAVADFDRAIALDPGYAQAYFYRGNVYYAQDKLDLALADLEQAIALVPGYAVAYLNRGVIYSMQGELDLAIADYSQAIELRPDYDQALVNRGLAYKEQGEVDSAIADFRQVLQVSNNPNLLQQAEQELQELGAEP